MNEETTNKRHHRFVLIGSIAYLLGISFLMLRHNIWFSPDQFFIFALVVAVVLGRGKRFIQDWGVVVLIFLSYEFFHGALPAILKFPVHSTDLINMEKAVFGTVPTLVLQGKFLNTSNYVWYDFYLSVVYMSFWVCPLIFLFYIWIRNRPLFKFLTLSFFILTYAAFITFTFFPAMPPWMASEKGLLEPVHRVLYGTTGYLTTPGTFPTIYSMFAGNTTAAMPSLHAAIPTLLFIFALLLKNKFIIFLTALYAVSVYISIVYLGEHWGIDAIAGIAYAIAAFFVARYVGRRFHLIQLPGSVSEGQ